MSASDLFDWYLFGLAPVFLYYFIQRTRKEMDVKLPLFISMASVSVLPILREVVLCLLLDLPNIVIFKKEE